ncbi:uncharacterized protein N7511_005938 [Penicillium nucicola]|uniref:uncharacterized protein n=1 Tax=Penicillium nucicola TaxID=1850975 RepID=UPI00254500A8|nr:uncharacterized protein N7511_005938 [Penicillium nucicola]KAJ5762556.1 hypothetical protein N7511_005938 [Penicillium nucicola]
MGQGYSLTTLSAGSAGIDVPELSDLVYEKSMGGGRFMKSIRARQPNGLVFIKVIMKPFPTMELEPYIKAITRERKLLLDVPNALSYQRILETSTSGYLVRQYIHSSLYDRMSTRPFLEHIEKKWIAFQLLCALRDCHSLDIYHGDIKTENVLVTAWNWLYLSDFSSSFKPTFLPEDNPADFSFFFDISGRRTCYLAPERFCVAGEEPSDGGINWAMDIFSAGCVIAELFLESPIFNLSQMYKYRKGEYSPEHSQLAKIEDPDIRELILHMIQLEPESRYSADEYLKFWKGKAFPEYFYSFLHQYMSLMTDPSSGRTDVGTESTNRGEADERIERVYLDFDKISYFLGSNSRPVPRLTGNTLPVKLELPNGEIKVSSRPSQTDEGVLIFLTLVVSNLRNTSKASARAQACDILLAFAERLSDEAKLDRVLPHVMIILTDRTDTVRVAAIRTLTKLLEMVQVVSPVNAYLFSEYIFPRLQPFVATSPTNPSPVVRAAYASCIASLAQSSLRFLDMIQALRSDTRLAALIPVGFEPRWTEDATYHNLYDVARIDLLEYFEVHTKALLTDTDASVRRAFLGSVSSLCVFFGNLKANEVVLSHLNTYLNDPDWILKCAFFKAVVGVAAYVGTINLELYILPLMVQSLTEPEEFVVERVIRSLAAMAGLGLFQRSTTWDLLHTTVGFLIHPDTWIREATVNLVVNSAKFLSIADIHSILAPLLRPFLKIKIIDFSEAKILGALKRPMPRSVYEMAFFWALKSDKGVFWKSTGRDGMLGLSEPGAFSSRVGQRNPSYTMSAQSRNEEDEQWLTRLRNIGMGSEDEFKLVALKDYIWRVSLRHSREADPQSSLPINEIVTLTQQNVKLQTVFFDKEIPDSPRRASLDRNDGHADDTRPRTIADALLDASTTIERAPSTQRKHLRSKSQVHKETRRPSGIPILDGHDSSSLSSSPLASSPAAGTASRPLSPPGSDVDRRHSTHRQSPDADDSSTPTRTNTPDLRSLSDRVSKKSSAINLLNRKDTTKAYAETGTSSANAFGKVDAPIHRGGTPQPATSLLSDERKAAQLPSQKYRPNHSYQGNDPAVLRLLDNVFAENYPTDLFDLGPYVKELDTRQPIHSAADQEPNKVWKPEGNLVATFGEHSAAINRVVVAPDHSFFATASDDSTVKIWDTTRLERNLTPRSRQTHRHATGSRVKALTFVENTYTFISAATDGSIHAVRVDYQKVGQTAVRYGKLQLVREYQLPIAQDGTAEYAVWMEHFRDEGQSTLLVATNTSRILALDMKTMLPIYTLENPVHHGTLTTFCCDRRHHWLLLGTTHGVLDLWDLRFRVRLKAWGLPGWGAINRIQVHPTKARGRWVCVSCSGSHGNEITVWDIEKFRCREVYQATPLGNANPTNGGHHPSRPRPPSRITPADYEAWRVDGDRPEGMLSRFAKPGADAGIPSNNNPAGDRLGIWAFAVGLNAPDEDKDSSTKCGYIITAGCDRKIRFWDLARPDLSSIVSGLDVVSDGSASGKPHYEQSQPGPSLLVTTEHLPSASASRDAKKASPRPPRSTVISLQQQMLLKSHLDIVQDVAVLRVPYGMIVSVDRAGMVYIFS